MDLWTRDFETAGGFIRWLNAGDNVHHISIKTRSGKSTLKIFICGQPRTLEELKLYSGRRQAGDNPPPGNPTSGLLEERHKEQSAGYA